MQQLEYDPAFQQAVRTSHAKRPPPTAAARSGMGATLPGGAHRGMVMPPSSMGMRPITAAQEGGAARPMTAVRAAGYSSATGAAGKGLYFLVTVN